MDAWERDLAARTQQALAAATEDGFATLAFANFAGLQTSLADVTITVDTLTEESDTLTEITVEICITEWSDSRIIERAEIVILAAIDPHEQHWTAGHGKTRIYSLCTARNVLAELPPADVAGRVIAGSHAHYAHKERIVTALVDGEALKALCGQHFVPQQDHESLPKCPTCEFLFSRLEPQTARTHD